MGLTFNPFTGQLDFMGMDQATADARYARLSSANTLTANSATSTPALSLNGTVFTGGTGTSTKPHFLVEPSGATSTSWNTAGTMVGINAATGFNGDILSLRAEGVNFFNFYYEHASGSCIFGPPASGFSFYANQFYPYPVNSLRLGRPGVSSWTGLDLTSEAPIEWNTDAGLARGGATSVKVTDGGSGYGNIDAAGYAVSGVAGTNFSGLVSNITITNGIVTAAS